MKKITILLASALFAVILQLTSCIEDKGNYSYNWVPKIEVTYPVYTDSLIISRGETLIVDMTFMDAHTGEAVQIDLQDYSYDWRIQPMGESFNALIEVEGDYNLNAPIFAPVSMGYHTVLFTAVHKETGEVITTKFRLRVTGAFTDAFLFLTEDAEGNVELELYGNDPEGNVLHHTGYLAGNEFPYTTGGANGISYDAFQKRVFIATGSGAGFLSTPDFSFDPLTNNLSDILLSQSTETFVKLERVGTQSTSNTGRAIYGFTEDGQVNIISGASTLIFSPNIALWGTEQVDIAPMMGGYGATSTQLLWNRTHRNLVYHYIESAASMARGVYVVSDVVNNIEDCLYLGSSALSARRLFAIVRDTDNTFWRLDYSLTGYVPVAARDPRQLTGTASLGTIAHWINSTADGYLYAITGDNTIYSYVEDQTGVVADPGWTAVDIVDTNGNSVRLTYPVEFIYRERNGNGMDDCFWVITYSQANGSRVYRFTPGSVSSTLILEDLITISAKVTKMCYFWG